MPLFLVHSKNDPVISSTWTQYAYDYLTDKRKNNAPIYYRIITSSNHGYRVVGEHFAWERMLNNDIVDSTGKVRTIDFLTGLAKSEGEFSYNAYKIPAPAASENKGTYKFDVAAEVKDAGERVNKIIIYMNGGKIDASSLKPEDFKVTVWAEDASGLNLEGATCGGKSYPELHTAFLAELGRKTSLQHCSGGSLTAALNTKPRIKNFPLSLGRLGGIFLLPYRQNLQIMVINTFAEVIILTQPVQYYPPFFAEV